MKSMMVKLTSRCYTKCQEAASSARWGMQVDPYRSVLTFRSYALGLRYHLSRQNIPSLI
jgi:hypothetical protein